MPEIYEYSLIDDYNDMRTEHVISLEYLYIFYHFTLCTSCFFCVLSAFVKHVQTGTTNDNRCDSAHAYIIISHNHLRWLSASASHTAPHHSMPIAQHTSDGARNNGNATGAR